MIPKFLFAVNVEVGNLSPIGLIWTPKKYNMPRISEIRDPPSP